jgi:predicted DNA-binding transcriptional regulator AlpA
MTNNLKFLRTIDVIRVTSLSKSTLERKIARGLMPPPFKISTRSIAFFEHEIQQVMLKISTESNENEIKNFVSGLVEKRKNYQLA